MQKTLQQLETRLIILQVINKKMEKPEVETSGFFVVLLEMLIGWGC